MESCCSSLKAFSSLSCADDFGNFQPLDLTTHLWLRWAPGFYFKTLVVATFLSSFLPSSIPSSLQLLHALLLANFSVGENINFHSHFHHFKTNIMLQFAPEHPQYPQSRARTARRISLNITTHFINAPVKWNGLCILCPKRSRKQKNQKSFAGVILPTPKHTMLLPPSHREPMPLRQ